MCCDAARPTAFELAGPSAGHDGGRAQRAAFGEQDRDMGAQLGDPFAAARRGEEDVWVGGGMLAQALERRGDRAGWSACFTSSLLVSTIA